MVCLNIWLLATIAALILASAIPVLEAKGEKSGTTHSDSVPSKSLLDVPPEVTVKNILFWLSQPDLNNFKLVAKLPYRLATSAEYYRYGGEVLYEVRRHLGLPAVVGKSDLVGLHTLIDGAQLEYRRVTHEIFAYLQLPVLDVDVQRDQLDINYPDLFLKYPFRNVAMPSFAEPWKNYRFQRKPISPKQIKHSLINLGVEPDIKNIINLITALFEALYSDNLLKNFQDIMDSTPPTPQANQGTDSTNQAPMVTNEETPEKYPTFTYQFWLQVIGNNNVVQLRYFLSNLLAFNVIPGIIGQVLESETPTDALHLAEQIHNIPGVTKVTEDFSGNAPNYFEFIMIYATVQKLGNPDGLLTRAQKMRNVDVQTLHDCYIVRQSNSPWHVFGDIFKLKAPENPEAWQMNNHELCLPLRMKYTRHVKLHRQPKIEGIFPSDQDMSYFVLQHVK